MALLTREELLSKDTLKIEKVDLDEEDYVYVREMTGRERENFEKSLTKMSQSPNGELMFKSSLEDFRAKFVVNILCDEEGNNLLKPEDYETLSKNMSARKLEIIASAALELNKMTVQSKEEMVKNLESGPGGDSNFGSV